MSAELKAQHNFKSRISLSENIPLSTPLVIYVEVSSFCNLSCGFCPQHLSPNEVPKNKMDLERFEEMCKQIKKFPETPKLIRFCGIGDSLTNNDFVKMLELANDYNIGQKLQLITNGVLLQNKINQDIIYLLDQIVVSIEGLSDEDYLEFANRKVNFKRHLETLRHLCSIKDRRAKFNLKIHSGAVQSQERLDFFYKTFDFADEIFVENLVNLWPELDSDMGINLNNKHRFLEKEAEKVVACPQIFKSLQVNANGVVVPCCIDWSAKNNLGKIDKKSLVDIWNSENLRDLRIKHLKGQRDTFLPCKDCTMNEFSEFDSIDSERESILKRILKNT